jgi:hypothetical protein
VAVGVAAAAKAGDHVNESPLAASTRELITVKDHVLVKGWHDQGGVEAVYGPFSKPHAEWLLAELLENSAYNWTLAKLSTYPPGWQS